MSPSTPGTERDLLEPPAPGLEACANEAPPSVLTSTLPPGMLTASSATSHPLAMNFQVDVAALKLLVEKMPFPEVTNTRSALLGSNVALPVQ
jgi:hypothetical protein